MAKGSGGTRLGYAPKGGAKIAAQFTDFERSNLYGLGSQRLKEMVTSIYNDEGAYNEALSLLRGHSLGEGAQLKADSRIYEEINNPNSKVGAALRAISDVNTAQFNAWKKGGKERLLRDQEAEYQSRISLGGGTDPWGKTKAEIYKEVESRENYFDIPVYRGGNSKNVEAWTRDANGADVGGGRRISVNMYSSISSKLKEGNYMFGVSNIMGSPGESEITFVRKKK